MKKRKILVIDDEEEVCKTVKGMLEARGFEAFTAFNGKDGIEKAQAQQPDLVLLDIIMPGLGGFEVLQKLRMNIVTQHIPVIIVSAKRDSESLFKARTLRSADYIMKPFSSQELLKTVSKSLGFFKLEDEQSGSALVPQIKNKLAQTKTVLDLLAQGKYLPNDFIDKAQNDLKDAINMLKGLEK
ncbi:PleD family two-component system response regulator [Candidatus Omnitrophota bacterium]